VQGRIVGAAYRSPNSIAVAQGLARLNACLDPLHRDSRAPLEQTLRAGTQNHDDLIGGGHEPAAITPIASIPSRARLGKAIIFPVFSTFSRRATRTIAAPERLS
jgi:hypothetical protein